ncbi:MAG: hypothetical protein RLZ14_2168, partial [Actinomycetota bacterium]
MVMVNGAPLPCTSMVPDPHDA